MGSIFGNSHRGSNESWRTMHGNRHRGRGAAATATPAPLQDERSQVPPPGRGLQHSPPATRESRGSRGHGASDPPPAPVNSPEKRTSQLRQPQAGVPGSQGRQGHRASRGSTRSRPSSVRPLDMDALRSALEKESEKVMSPAQKIKGADDMKRPCS